MAQIQFGDIIIINKICWEDSC